MSAYPIPTGWWVLSAAPTGATIPPVADPQPVSMEEGMWIANGKEAREWHAPAEAPPIAYRLLTPNQVIDLMLSVIGAAGFAACVRSDAGAMVIWRYKMSVARDITKDQAAAGFSIIVAATLMTTEQRTAILAAWPTA